MSKYLDLIYPEPHGNYPNVLCQYLVKRFGIEGRLLDIGGGTGDYTQAFIRLGIDAYNLERDICNLEISMIPFRDNHFNYIFCKSVIEHVRNTDHLLSEALRVLKPGGMAIFMAPDWETDYRYFYDDYTHVRAFTKKGIYIALNLAGFVDVKCEHFYQLPFLWLRPYLEPLRWIISLFPDSFKYKDSERTKQRVIFRHSKERMLLCTGSK